MATAEWNTIAADQQMAVNNWVWLVLDSMSFSE